jgi:DNA polymerase kappa
LFSSSTLDFPKSDSALMANQGQRDMGDLVVYAGNNKSGMESADESKQKDIIQKMSAGSSYMDRAERMDDRHEEALKKLVEKKNKFSATDLLNFSERAETKEKELEKLRSFTRHMVVLDFDAFYAMVEERDNPELKGKPLAVGGGMITTSNYVARKFGVRSGMPMFVAKKLCPGLINVPCNFGKYKIASEQMKAVVLEYDSNPSMGSLDEIIFDLTDAATARYRKEHRGHAPGSAADLRELVDTMVWEIRELIKIATGGLTSSAGIANNCTLAKICSSVKKPDGQFSLAPSRYTVMSFLSTLSLRAVPGIGRVFEKYLRACGFETLGDVQNQLGMCLYLFERDKSSSFLLGACLGIAKNEGSKRLSDENLPSSAVTRRSMGCERSFSTIYSTQEMIVRLLSAISKLAEGMAAQSLHALTVTLKVKTAKYDLFTRATTLSKHIQTAKDIEAAAVPLLEEIMRDGQISKVGVRLIGVACSQFRGGLNRQQRESSRSQPMIEKYFTTTAATAAATSKGRGSGSGSGSTKGGKSHFSSSSSIMSSAAASSSAAAAAALGGNDNPKDPHPGGNNNPPAAAAALHGGSASDPFLLLSSQSDDDGSVDLDEQYHSQHSQEDRHHQEHEQQVVKPGLTDFDRRFNDYDDNEEEGEDGDEGGGENELRAMAAASVLMTEHFTARDSSKSGGGSSGKSISGKSNISSSSHDGGLPPQKKRTFECPVCGQRRPESRIQGHVNQCLGA